MDEARKEEHGERSAETKVKAHEIVPNVEVNPRRQDKIIAAIVRRNPRLTLVESVTLTGAERQQFNDRCDDTRLDKIRDSDYEAALAATPPNVKEPKAEANLQRLFTSFAGDAAEQRRMRRVVAFVSKGSIKEQGSVKPDDLYTFVRQKCRSAVAFEQMMPDLLAAVDDAEAYKPILNDVAVTLYGSQWIYLQQGRLAEASARGELPNNEDTTALNIRLEAFNAGEPFHVPNVPHPKYSLHELRTGSQDKVRIGEVVICRDRKLDGDGVGNVLAGYDKSTGTGIAVKKHVQHDEVTSEEAARREDRIKALGDPFFLTHSVLMPLDGDMVRAYPMMAGDLEGYLKNNGALSSKDALGMMIQIGQGVRKLHQEGITHFDVAASNIMIDHKGAVHLGDFDGSLFPGETKPHNVMVGGNVFIRPPELYENQFHSGPVVDTYEAATLLYQSVVGEKAFSHIPWNHGEDVTIRRQRFYEARKSGDFIVPEQVPDAIKKIIVRGMDPDPSKRYQTMDAMLLDMLEAYESTAESTSVENLFKQPKLIDTPAVSPRLAVNPEARLHATTEMTEYLSRQDKEYFAQLKALDEKIGQPMHKDTKAAVCIPVAGAQETATIYKTVAGFADQSIGTSNFELVLLVNTPEKFATNKAAEVKATLAEIARAKQDFPHLAVRVADVTLPDDQVNIWNIRKIATDLAVLRANEAGITEDVLLLSNDADNEGVSDDYLKAFVDYFSEHPEKEGAVGNLRFDPKGYVRFPDMAIKTELSTRLDQQGFRNGNVTLFGGNSVMKASIYCAIGGYPSKPIPDQGEQEWTGVTIRKLREQKGTLGFVDGALLTTSSRRQAMRAVGLRVSPGNAEEQEQMRSLDVMSIPIFDWDDTAAAVEMTRSMTDQLNRCINDYEGGERLGKDSWYYRNNLEAMGIQYRVEGNPKDLDSKIVITDMREFVRRQKRMAAAINSGEENMAKILEAAA